MEIFINLYNLNKIFLNHLTCIEYCDGLNYICVFLTEKYISKKCVSV
jgi:hypothetical protein